MYRALPGVVEAAVSRAREIVAQERAHFDIYRTLAQRYAAKHGLVASDVGLILASGDRHAATGETLLFYSQEPERDARALVDLYLAEAPQPLVSASEEPPYIVVRVDQRELVRLRGLPEHRGVDTFALLLPETVSLPDGGRLQHTGAELQLIETYRLLCDPAQSADWAEAAELEAQLHRLLEQGETRVTRGGDEEPSPEKLYKILRRALDPAHYCIVGRHALGEAGRLQLVTARKLREAERDIRQALQAEQVVLGTTINNVYVPTDPDLRRLTVHLERGSERRPLLDVYDSGRRELIPLAPQQGRGLRRGCFPAVARYLLTDVWTMRLLVKMGKADKKYADRVSRAALDLYLEGRAAGRLPWRPEPDTANYLGRYVDPRRDAKRKALRGRKMQRYYGTKSDLPSDCRRVPATEADL